MTKDPGQPQRFCQRTARVLENSPMAKLTYRMTLEVPEIAGAIRPGQFLMVRLPNQTDPLLGRPYALYDTVLDSNGETYGLSFVYLVVGKQTQLLTSIKEGHDVEVWGPLGNGFGDVPVGGHIALVAGGIGQTPFLAYVRDLLGVRGYGGFAAEPKAMKVSVYYGVREEALLAGVEDFENAGGTVHIATNDGSRGHHGFVTDLLEDHIPTANIDGVVGCGPDPILQVLSRICKRRLLRCHDSLETPMACGVGISFSCVASVATPHGPDYSRV